MSDRVSYLLAVILLLIAAFLRIHEYAALPPGLSPAEIDNARIIETVRGGNVETFYNLRGEGREPLYHLLVTSLTWMTGSGTFGYRLLSLFVGMLTLAVVYVLGKRLFGTLGGLSALALMAFGFLPILLSRLTLPEMLLPLLAALTLLTLAQSLSVHRPHVTRPTNSIAFAALGVVLGFGFYIHPLHFPIVLTAMFFIAYIILTRQPISRAALGFTAFGILVMIIIVMPYLIASIRQPELAGAGRVLAGVGNSIISTLLNGIFGIFFRGDTNAAYNLPARPLLDLVSGLLVVLGLLVVVRGWRQPRYALVLIALLVLLPFALLSPQAPDFLRFAPLLPVLALLFGASLSAIASTATPRGRLVLAALVIALVAFNLQWVWRDLFGEWRTLGVVQMIYQERLGQIARHIDRTADSLPTIICTPELYPPDDALQLISAQQVALMMHRSTMGLRFAECGSGLVLANGGERQQIIFLEADGLERMNPYLRTWIDTGSVLTQLGIPPQSVVILDVSASLADVIGRFTTTATASFPPEAGGENSIAVTPVRLGGNIAFLGYDAVATASFAPGDVAPFYTYWRVDGIVPRDLRLFTHLLSDPQVIAVQEDLLSVRPDGLQPRDIIVQATLVQLPFTMPEGVYIISTGAYEASLGTRLGVFDGDQLRANRLFIGTLQVSR
ncbi:MAG: glycosyltransferase family 39 protein [Chloroflexota bacterium]|nr:glycosyltransferase family 39 protein [Chloroflexota bacterium]